MPKRGELLAELVRRLAARQPSTVPSADAGRLRDILRQLPPGATVSDFDQSARPERYALPLDRRPATIRAATVGDRLRDAVRGVYAGAAEQPVGRVMDALGVSDLRGMTEPPPLLSLGMMPDRPSKKLGDLVREAAKRQRVPNPIKGYRGTPQGVATPPGATRFYSSKEAVADGYTYPRGIWRSSVGKGAVEQSEIVMSKPLVIDALGKRNDNIPVPWQEWKPKVYGNLPENAMSVEKAAEYAKANGYDGLVVRNVVDTADPTDKIASDVYAVFDDLRAAGRDKGQP